MRTPQEENNIQSSAPVSPLRELQLRELDILLEIRRICNDHGLAYYLTGGTLLGAVRHKGFIPWDDDIDIVMPREDYDRFAALCPGALAPGFTYHSKDTDRDYPHYFAKVRRRGGEGEPEGFVDVFPLDKCPDKKLPAMFFFKGTRVLTTAVLTRTDKNFVCGYTRWYMDVLRRLLAVFPTRWLIAWRDVLPKVFDRFSSGQKVCNVGGRYSYPGEVRDISWYSEKTELSFEGHMFSVPSGWDALLTNMFGDYMTPPAEADRQGHFL